MEPGVRTYVELLQMLLRENQNVLDLGQIRRGMGYKERDEPSLACVELGDDLSVKLEANAEYEAYEGLSALFSVIYEFLSIMVDEEEVQQRLVLPGRKFLEDRAGSVPAGDMSYFPDILMKERVARPDVGVLDQVVRLYEDLFSALLRQRLGSGDAGDPKRAVLDYVAERGLRYQISVMDDGSVRIETGVDDPVQVAEDLSGALNRLVTSDGKEGALTRAKSVLSPILTERGDLVEEMGIDSLLLGGLMARRVPFGVETLDDMTGGGMPRNSSVLVQGPASRERDAVLHCFARDGLEKGGCLLASATAESPAALRKRFSGLADEAGGGPGMFILDWYTCNDENVANVEDEGRVVKSTEELTNVGIALDKLVQRMDDDVVKRAVIDIVSPAITMFGFERVYSFVQSVIANFKANDITALFVMDSEMHTTETIHLLHQAFDGVVDLRNSASEGREVCECGIISMRGTSFETDYRTLERDVLDRAGHPIQVTRSTGSLSVDKLLGGGIPLGASLTVATSHCPEREVFLKNFCKRALLNGEPLLLVLSSTSPSEFLASLREDGIEVEKHLENSSLAVVDWFSYKNEVVSGVQLRDGVVKSSYDLTNVGIALEKAIGTLREGRTRKALVDLLSPALEGFEFQLVYDFAKNLATRLKRWEMTSIVTVDLEMHNPKILAALGNLFDGTVELKRTKLQMRMGADIRVKWMKGMDFVPGSFPLAIEDGELVVGSKKGGEQKDGSERQRTSRRRLRRRRATAAEITEEMAERERAISLGEKELERSINDLNERERVFSERLHAFSKEIESLQKQRQRLRSEREEIEEKRRALPEDAVLFNDMKAVLLKLDGIIKRLPEDSANGFATSEEYAAYKRVLERLSRTR